jgi:hypothetical protein
MRPYAIIWFPLPMMPVGNTWTKSSAKIVASAFGLFSFASHAAPSFGLLAQRHAAAPSAVQQMRER